jgi:hypothetical protein
MATIREEAARLQWLISKGRGEEKAHVILIEEEARKRKENAGPQPKTRFQFETDDPDMYSRLNELKDRWLKGRNKSVALSVMADHWDLSEEDIAIECGDRDAES